MPFLQDCCSTFQDLLDRCEAHSPLPMSRVIELERGRMSVPSKVLFWYCTCIVLCVLASESFSFNDYSSGIVMYCSAGHLFNLLASIEDGM